MLRAWSAIEITSPKVRKGETDNSHVVNDTVLSYQRTNGPQVTGTHRVFEGLEYDKPESSRIVDRLQELESSRLELCT